MFDYSLCIAQRQGQGMIEKLRAALPRCEAASFQRKCSMRPMPPTRRQAFLLVTALSLLPALNGCAVVTVAGAVAGAAISVGGAVVSTGVKVTGKVIEKTVDVVTPAP